jgi:hypothetical protein
VGEELGRVRPAAPRTPPGSSGPVTLPAGMVRCPICLHEIRDWHTLDYWEWDPVNDNYVELRIPPDLNDTQLGRHLQGAFVRCPRSQGDAKTAHYLPAGYGRFGTPVVLGLVGLTESGKTHLLASMVGAIERGELQEYGISVRPLDHVSHQRYLREHVEPLLNEGKQLMPTQENLVTFADAFLMKQDDGQERPVILFDIAGGDLAKEGRQKEFLWTVAGLFFVVDPDFMRANRVGDRTFSNVLSVVTENDRGDPVSAAIVLNKADKVRFDEPVARWLRSPATALDAGEFLRESADVYAYLQANEAGAVTRPYRECQRATLHFASPSGGAGEGVPGLDGTFPRGVTPRRVVRPLAAMLAMTGVLTGPEAEKVGI